MMGQGLGSQTRFALLSLGLIVLKVVGHGSIDNHHVLSSNMCAYVSCHCLFSEILSCVWIQLLMYKSIFFQGQHQSLLTMK